MADGLVIKPLRPSRMEDLGQVLKGSWGRTCWCMHPRLREPEMKALPGTGPLRDRRRTAMTALAGGRRAPGLIAYLDGRPVGWVAVAPRDEFGRVATSRATPALEEGLPVWVIPCITVRKDARGQGVAVALIRQAALYALSQGAPAVEAYPRAGGSRTGDDNAYFGTEPLFLKAGFRVAREPLEGLPKNWLPRVTMRFVAHENVESVAGVLS